MIELWNHWIIELCKQLNNGNIELFMRLFEWMNRGMMKGENNKMNEWLTNESVEWWNSGMIKVCNDGVMLWQNIGIRKYLGDQLTK